MKIRCVWEHNGDDSLLYCVDYIGAYTRGERLDTAKEKIEEELAAYSSWKGHIVPEDIRLEIIQEKQSDLLIADADSDVLFDEERAPLSMEEYLDLRALALKSAADFYAMYESIPQKDTSPLPSRRTFYGQAPRTAREMYEHTKNVNAYYFGEIGIDTDNDGTILECRKRGFEQLEQTPEFLSNSVINGSYGELWTVRKMLRRFIWHDRIHAKAMYRMAIRSFGTQRVKNPFGFLR